jgi:hypothetical protein
LVQPQSRLQNSSEITTGCGGIHRDPFSFSRSPTTSPTTPTRLRKIGDRKCDGLFFEKGVVFQVYSPDELTQAALKKKIREDLAGAVKHWKTAVTEWVFVYNVRPGLPSAGNERWMTRCERKSGWISAGRH